MVSGLIHATCRPLKTRFRFGSASVMLNLASNRNSLARSTKSTRSWRMPLSLLVNTRFQILFHSPLGVLFTFPSRYFSLSVVSMYLALDGGPPCFPPGSSCPVVLWIPAHSSLFRVRGSHSLCRTFPDTSTKVPNLLQVRNPKEPKSSGLGSSRFARRYSGNLA